MKIAIDVSPLNTGHKIRGVGFYLKHLKEALEKYFPDDSYTYFDQTNKLPKDIELIHYPYFDPFFLTLPKGNKKVVVTVHDLTPLVLSDLFPIGLKGKIKWFLQKKSLKKVNAIITDSYASKKDIERLVGISGDKVHVAYLAPGEKFRQLHSKDALKKIKEKYSLPDKFILYVGDVTANKNLPRLVKAVREVGVPLVMIGKSLVAQEFDKTNPWNKDLVEVQELVRGNSLIICLGFVSDEDLVVLYNAATIFAMPSLYEGFGLPVIEAMACGCPVLTSHAGSLEEVADDAAYIVDPYSVKSIADGLQVLAKDEKLRKQLSQQGLLQAKKFSWKKTAEETIKIYERVIA